MVHGSWLKARGPWPRWVGPAPGRGARPQVWGQAWRAPGSGDGPAPLGHEPWTIDNGPIDRLMINWTLMPLISRVMPLKQFKTNNFIPFITVQDHPIPWNTIQYQKYKNVNFVSWFVIDIDFIFKINKNLSHRRQDSSARVSSNLGKRCPISWDFQP